MPDKNTPGRQLLPLGGEGGKQPSTTDIQIPHSYTEESSEEAAGDKPAPLDECYLHNVTGSTSCEQTFQPAKRSIAGSQSHMQMTPSIVIFSTFLSATDFFCLLFS